MPNPASCKIHEVHSLEEVVRCWFQEAQPHLLERAEIFMVQREMRLLDAMKHHSVVLPLESVKQTHADESVDDSGCSTHYSWDVLQRNEQQPQRQRGIDSSGSRQLDILEGPRPCSFPVTPVLGDIACEFQSQFGNGIEGALDLELRKKEAFTMEARTKESLDVVPRGTGYTLELEPRSSESLETEPRGKQTPSLPTMTRHVVQTNSKPMSEDAFAVDSGKFGRESGKCGVDSDKMDSEGVKPFKSLNFSENHQNKRSSDRKGSLDAEFSPSSTPKTEGQRSSDSKGGIVDPEFWIPSNSKTVRRTYLPQSNRASIIAISSQAALQPVHALKSMVTALQNPRSSMSGNAPDINTAQLVLEQQEENQIQATLRSVRRQGYRRSLQTTFDFKEPWCNWLRNPNLERWLDGVMAFIVVLNVLQLGASSDIMRNWRGWLAADAFFTSAFLVEFILKLGMRGVYVHFVIHSRWTFFDGCIVAVAIVEVISGMRQADDQSAVGRSMSVLRVVRLLRLVRIIKVLRLPMFKDLLMMLDGLIGGARTLFWSFVLLMVPIYSSALLLRETIGEEEEGENTVIVRPFTTLAYSFFTVFRCIMGDCTSETGQPLPVLMSKKFGWYYAVGYICLIVITAFGFFNVIIAIYVENIVVAAKRNDSIQRQRRLGDRKRLNELLAALICEFLEACSKEGTIDPADAANLEITKPMFEEVTRKPLVRGIFEKLDIPYEDQVDLFDALDADGSGELSLAEILDGLKKLRGEPRRSDVISNGLAIRAMQKRADTEMEKIIQTLQRHSVVLQTICKSNESYTIRILEKISRSDACLQRLGSVIQFQGAVRTSSRSQWSAFSGNVGNVTV